MTHKIAIIGLGYVGLPLARIFATKYPVIGFDINKKRVDELNRLQDLTLELTNEDLRSVWRPQPPKNSEKGLFFTHNPKDITDCNTFIITVPTPVDKKNLPNLQPLYQASETVGQLLKKGDLVIYESTVYPGVTEEECIPVLENLSGLKLNEDFFAGYSPERINPGDREHTVEKILKVTSGSNPKAAQIVDHLYKSVITAGTHLAPSIKVAEAAKVIENSQRDINIAFVNELAKIFNLMEIDTHEVLKAAGTKWNFLPFKPGLVGGHCIGVDPYYLAQKAQEFGYHPEIILAGRRLNDSMGAYVAAEVVKFMLQNDIAVKHAEILVLGISFKENCGDVRNSKVADVVKNLMDYGTKVSVFDPWVNPEDVKDSYGFSTLSQLPESAFDTVVLAVAHEKFLSLDLQKLLRKNGIIYDVKGVLKAEKNIKHL